MKFWERYIQNHGIFRTQGIFKILPNIYHGTFCIKELPSTLLGPSSKNKTNSDIFSKKAFLRNYAISQAKELYYISRNENPKNLLIFQEITFQAQKIKRTHSEETSYILRGNLKSLKIKNVLYFFL